PLTASCTVSTVSGSCRIAASCIAHSRARWGWPEPSAPTIIPDIAFSLCRWGSPAPLLSTLGVHYLPDKGRAGCPPGSLVLNPGWTDCLELTCKPGPRGLRDHQELRRLVR